MSYFLTSAVEKPLGSGVQSITQVKDPWRASPELIFLQFSWFQKLSYIITLYFEFFAIFCCEFKFCIGLYLISKSLNANTLAFVNFQLFSFKLDEFQCVCVCVWKWWMHSIAVQNFLFFIFILPNCKFSSFKAINTTMELKW